MNELEFRNKVVGLLEAITKLQTVIVRGMVDSNNITLKTQEIASYVLEDVSDALDKIKK